MSDFPCQLLLFALIISVPALACGERDETQFADSSQVAADGAPPERNASSDAGDAGPRTPVAASADPCSNPSAVFTGRLEIGSAADLAAASAYRCVNGSVALNLGFLGTNVRLPGIEVVSGSFFVGGSADLEQLDVPDLRIVGYGADFGSLAYPLPALRKLVLPSLERVGDVLNVSGTGLAEISLPSLAATGGTLSVSTNPELTRLSVPALAKVGFASIADNAKLPQCDVDGLFSALVSKGADAARLESRNNDAGAVCP